MLEDLKTSQTSQATAKRSEGTFYNASQVRIQATPFFSLKYRYGHGRTGRTVAAGPEDVLLLLHKQVHDKRGIAESLHAQMTRARLTACKVGVFSREISQLSKIHPPPSFRSHLSSSPMGVFSRDYGTIVQLLYQRGSHVSPVEAFATGIKIFDQQKVCLVA